MSAKTLPKPVTAAPPSAPTPDEWPSHIVLNTISWKAYEGIGDLLHDQPIRMTYDGGSLEIMTLSRAHERQKSLLGLLIEMLAIEIDVDLCCGGSMTFKREASKKGAEADECYWVQNEPGMRAKDTFDPDMDPPPDLAIEVEVSRTVLDRLAVLAEVRVPEVWRFDGQTIVILLLGLDGTYAPSPTSRAFPFFPVAELVRFLAMRATQGDTKLARAFRDWVRENRAAWGR